MHDDGQTGSAQTDWVTRAAAHGDSPRAVLLKGLPDSINDSIDRWHRHVLREAFNGANTTNKPVLDLGCGYGRLAIEAKLLGLGNGIVGIDYTPDFCKLFKARCGDAVCGSLSSLPFAPESFSHAYSVTALMYLDVGRVREALTSLDHCMVRGARVLLLEPGAEFNRVVRQVLRYKRGGSLTRPGFSRNEFYNEIVPPGWRRVASGSNAWTTLLLPALILLQRLEGTSRRLAALCEYMDRPRAASPTVLSRFALHRWAVYEIL